MAGDEWLMSRAAPDGGRLRLRFARRGDRLHQTIEWLAAVGFPAAPPERNGTQAACGIDGADGAEKTLAACKTLVSHMTDATDKSPATDAQRIPFGVPLLESCEGHSGDTWPDSPPLQQLLIEPRGAAGHVALLVGMAGRSHWSLSVEPLADRVGFRFDAACRLGGPPKWLGHVWRTAAATRELSVPNGHLRIVAEDGAACHAIAASESQGSESQGSESHENESQSSPQQSSPQQSSPQQSSPQQSSPQQSSPQQVNTQEASPSETAAAAVVTPATVVALATVDECRVQAVKASSLAATGRFPVTVQWRFVIEWVPGPS